jgi:hypothetical protein
MTEIWDQFRSASMALVGPGPVKQRLCEAYLKHLRTIAAADPPRELQAEYAALAEALHCSGAVGGLNGVEVTVRKMSEAEAAREAARILGIFATLCGGSARGPATAASAKLRVISDDDEIPAFLSRA